MYNRDDLLKLTRSIMENDEGTDEHLQTLDDTGLSRMLFHAQVGDNDNVRLSQIGYEYLKQSFESYEIEFPDDYHLTTRDILLLSERCRCPYFVSAKAKMFGFFETEMATHIKLIGGNLSLLI